jgi:hypothetical protein
VLYGRGREIFWDKIYQARQVSRVRWFEAVLLIFQAKRWRETYGLGKEDRIECYSTVVSSLYL